MALAGGHFSPSADAEWHLLRHLIAGADMRALDRSYAAGQLEQIKAQMSELQRE